MIRTAGAQLSTHHLPKGTSRPLTTTFVGGWTSVPTRESADQNKYMRRRIRLYVLADMKKKNLGEATVVRMTKVDKSALNKFLDKDGELTLGLDNFIKLVRGLGLDANEIIHNPHPHEKRDGSHSSPAG